MRCRRALVVLAATPLVLLAACGSADQPGASATVTSTVTQSASASTSDSASASASASPAAPAQCRTADLKAAIGDPDGAAGSSHSVITITNTGTASCTTGGFGGVSYVGGEAGVQLGAAAVRDTSTPVTTIVLAPGKSATAQLQEGTAENYPKATCQPAKAQGLKIIPPDETEALFVRHPTTVCRAASVELLHLQAYVAG